MTLLTNATPINLIKSLKLHISPNTEIILSRLAFYKHIFIIPNLDFSSVGCGRTDSEASCWVISSLWRGCRKFPMLCAKWKSLRQNVQQKQQQRTDPSENNVPTGSNFKIIYLLEDCINLLIIGYSLQTLLFYLRSFTGCRSKRPLIVHG